MLDGVFPVPLPARVAAELVRQSAEVLAAELPSPTGAPTVPATARG